MKFNLINSLTILCLFYCLQNVLPFKLPGTDSLVNTYGKLKNSTSDLFESDKNSTKVEKPKAKPKATPKNDNPVIRNNSTKPAGNSSDEVCYEPFGCFKKKYYSERNLPSIGYYAPDKLDNLDLTIMHFSNLETKGQKLSYNSSKMDNYLVGRRVYFAIHGSFF